MKTAALASIFGALFVSACGSSGGKTASNSSITYEQVATIPVGGDTGGWDYLSEDPASHRLYVTNGTRVVVVDTNRDDVLGDIDGLQGVHGFALATDLNRGFASNGRDNNVAIVDLNTLDVTGHVDTGENPDAIIYLPDHQEVYAFNGRGHSATVFNAVSGDVLATIPLPGKPEFAVYDPKAQRIYNNIEDKNEIVALDPSNHEVVDTWSIAPCESPSGLAIDVDHHRLFAVCQNQMMVMVNSENGSVVDTVPIGNGPDAARFDPGTQLAFSSNGRDGTVTIVHEDSPDHLRAVQTLQTTMSARTMTLDPVTHRIYLSAADFNPPPEPDSTGHRSRPSMVPGSFRILEYGLES